MAKSIMQDKEKGYCFLCAALHIDYSRKVVLEEHHVMHGTANRRLAEKYGLKVYLCPEHHRLSEEAVHRNHEIDEHLKRMAQKAFLKRWNRDNPEEDADEKWMSIFGKNYL